MLKEKRNQLILKLANTLNDAEISKKLRISRARVWQIKTGYKGTYKPISIENLKIYTKRKKESLGLPTGRIGFRNGGRDHFRELVRMRDNHTCQICLKKWEPRFRRFDVHHEDESMEGRSGERGAIKLDKDNFDKMTTLCHKCHLNLDSVRKKMSLGNRKIKDLSPA